MPRGPNNNRNRAATGGSPGAEGESPVHTLADRAEPALSQDSMRRSVASLRQGALALAVVVAFPFAAKLIRGQVGVTEKACKTCHDAYTKE